MGLVALCVTAVLLITTLRGSRRRHEDDSEQDAANAQAAQDVQDDQNSNERPALGWKIAAMLVGLLTFVLVILLNDFSLPMVLINEWTFLIAIVFILHILFVVIGKVRDKDKQQGSGTPAPAESGA
jgi:CBS domain containing-hemolysin-like protein